MAKTYDVRTYVLLEQALIRKLVREWRKDSSPLYQAIAQACHAHNWDKARQLVSDLDLSEIGLRNREWIKYLLLSIANFGAGLVTKGTPSFIGVGNFDTLLNQVTDTFLLYLEHDATRQVQMEALQLIAEDEQKTKTQKWDESQPRIPAGSSHGGEFAPKIYKTPSDIKANTGGWPGYPIRHEWVNEPGHLLTGRPIDRKDLPETLYHVTTNASAVEATGGLLGQHKDAGLGGGTEEGVSFTTSRDDATVIQRELKRAVRIARGEYSIEDLDRYAREDEKEAGLAPHTLDKAVGFAKDQWGPNQQSIEHTFVWDKNLPEDQRGYVGPPPPKEEQERLRRSSMGDAHKAYLQIRGDQENPLLKNPILFGRQEHLKQVDPSNIKTFEVPSKNIPEGTLITTGSDDFLHEVRAYSDVPIKGHKKIAIDCNFLAVLKYDQETQKREGPFKYGSTQIDIPDQSETGKALTQVRKEIKEADTAGHGKEEDSHITIRYGLLETDREDELRQYLSQLDPFTITLGKVVAFEESEHSEGTRPVVVMVEGKELHQIHAEISQYADFKEESFPVYTPHITLAYCKPEAAEKYQSLKVAGSFLVDAITISHKSGVKETIPFGMVKKYDQTEPRDTQGKWTKGTTTDSPEKTGLISPEGTRLETKDTFSRHLDAQEQGYVRIGLLGVEMRQPLTEAQATVIAKDWNTVYHRSLDVTVGDPYLDSTGLVDLGRGVDKKFSYPVKASELVEWSKKAYVEWKKLLVRKADEAGRYATPFVSFDRPGEDKLQLIASLNASRMATWGFTAEADQRGVQKYKLSAVLDGRTSRFCRVVANNRIFEVSDAKAKVNEVLQVSDPNALRSVQPWPRQDKKSLAQYQAMSNEELKQRGLHIPPFHPSCRTVCTLVGKVPKALPPAPQAHSTQIVSQDTFKEMGITVSEQDVDDWNAHLGVSPVEVLSQLSSESPLDIVKGVLGKRAIQFTDDGVIKFNAKGAAEDVSYNIKSELDPLNGHYSLTQADLVLDFGAELVEESQSEFLHHLFFSLTETGGDSSADTLGIEVGQEILDYLSLGFLPDELAWDTIRSGALDRLNGDLKSLYESLTEQQQGLVVNLLQDRDETSMGTLADLNIDFEGKPLGKWLFEGITGQVYLDLTDKMVMAQAQEYLSGGK